jgi:hypothetical protein
MPQACHNDQIAIQGASPTVGIEFDFSEWYIQWHYPLEDSWNKIDDRQVNCVLSLEYEQTTGSARGTRR